MQRPKRKHLSLAWFALALPGALAACGYAAGEQPAREQAPRQPNVVLVVLDTTRGDRCSVNGYGRPTTPNLEALAGEGATFTDCWSPSPWTAPAHAALFTGLRPQHHGLAGGAFSLMLADAHETLAERLNGAGYATACYTANTFISPLFGLTQGFDTNWACWQQEELEYPIAGMAHRLAVDWALARHDEGRPFFVFVNDIEPHAPYEPHEPHRGRFLPTNATKSEIADAEGFNHPRTIEYTLGLREETPRTLQLVSDLYDGEIATVDATLGPLVESLRTAGLLDDTIVIVTGDHGENLGEHHLAEHVFSVNRTLLHVPLVIRYPWAFAAGTRVDDVVRLEDLFPTILELCGLETPEGLDGKSLLRDLGGRIAIAEYEEQRFALRTVKAEFPDVDLTPFQAAMRSVYDGRLHFIHRSDGRQELFDVRTDPLETVNLAGSRTDEMERLRAYLTE